MDYYKGMIIFMLVLLFSGVVFVPLHYFMEKDNPFSLQSIMAAGMLFFLGVFGVIFGLFAIAYVYPKYQKSLFQKENYKGLDKDNF